MRGMVLILTLGLLLPAAGCAVNQEFVRSVDGYTRVILPDYKEYVEKDPALSEDTRRIRIQTADRFQELVDAAKEK